MQKILYPGSSCSEEQEREGGGDSWGMQFPAPEHSSTNSHHCRCSSRLEVYLTPFLLLAWSLSSAGSSQHKAVCCNPLSSNHLSGKSSFCVPVCVIITITENHKPSSVHFGTCWNDSLAVARQKSFLYTMHLIIFLKGSAESAPAPKSPTISAGAQGASKPAHCSAESPLPHYSSFQLIWQQSRSQCKPTS